MKSYPPIYADGVITHSSLGHKSDPISAIKVAT